MYLLKLLSLSFYYNSSPFPFWDIFSHFPFINLLFISFSSILLSFSYYLMILLYFIIKMSVFVHLFKLIFFSFYLKLLSVNISLHFKFISYPFFRCKTLSGFIKGILLSLASTVLLVLEKLLFSTFRNITLLFYLTKATLLFLH